MKYLFTTLLAMVVASATIAAGKTPVICGSVVSSTVADRSTGVYTIPARSDAEFTLLGTTEAANGGAVKTDDVYYVTNLVDFGFYAQVRIYPYDTSDWSKKVSSYIYANSSNLTTDMAVDPATGTIYGAFLSSSRDSYNLANITFDLTTEKTVISDIAPLSKQMSALAFAADSQLYGIDTDGILYKIDKTTAALEQVGATGVATKVDLSGYAPGNPASGAIDPVSGMMYWTVITDEGKSQLYEVDLTTAAATLLNTFAGNEEIRGLYISAPEAEDGAPAVVTDLTAEFEPGSLSGQISFTAPTKTYAGEPLSGNLDFRILANGTQISSGKIYTGVNRSVDVTLPEKGQYEIAVILSNTVGDSPTAKITTFAGYNAPSTPTVTVSDYYGSLKVEWTPVTMADAEVTYRVVRYPDELVIAESTADTDLIDRIPSSDRAVAYRYGVKAIANGTMSEEGLSDVFVAGHMTPPYTEKFPDEASTDLWTIIDSNNDGYTWSFYYDEMRAQANSKNAADDWLISPPIAINGFDYYTVSVDVKSESVSYPGKFELRYGTSPDADAMTSVLVEPTVINPEGYVTYKAQLRIVGDSDNYYFGIHALTEPDMWWMRATNFSVSAPLSGNVPAAPESIIITPDYNGALSAEIVVTAPSKTISGDVLSSISKIDIFRNGELIHTATNVTPGAKVTFLDNKITEKGIYTYTAVTTNDSGSGFETKAAAFIGINKPASPNNATAVETSNTGEVKITWTAPETYIDGTPMNPALVTYNIYTPIYGQDVKIQTGLTETTTTFQAILPDEEQMFFYYGITAQTEEGENAEMAVTDQIPLGKPYSAPYCDSFADVKTNYAYGTGADNSRTYWDFYSDSAFEDVKSQDSDNGMFAMFGVERGNKAHFRTGKVLLEGMTDPTLTFYVYNMVGTLTDTNTLEVLVDDRQGFTSLGTWTISDFGTEGWHRIEIPLTEYIGKETSFKFVGTIDTYQYIHIDNIQLRHRDANDIAVNSIAAPERLKAGNGGTIEVKLQNIGLNTAENFTVELFRDGNKIDSKTVSSLISDAIGSVVFTISHNVTTPAAVNYEAKIVYADDRNSGNNTKSVEVATIYPNYPCVTDLKAQYTADDPTQIQLKWSAPDLTGSYADDVTDGFESYDAWSNNTIGDWKLVDGDHGGIYGFGSYFELPGLPTGSAQSWWVMNDTYQPMVDHFSSPDFYRAYAGHQYLAQMSVMDGETSVRCNDWAISPLLYGGSQTISFVARSFFDTDPETFELLYSTTGSEISDFKLLETKTNVPNIWTKYFFDLPEGAKYFAIRCTSRDCFMLMIDDVTYTPAGESGSLKIAGYNVYCNGTKINEDLVSDTKFTAQRQMTDEILTYTVTVVYTEKGESQFSNGAVPEISGVEQLIDPSVDVTTQPGEIIITGAEGLDVAVYALDGRIVTRRQAEPVTTISVSSGIYVVTVNNAPYKVIVK